MKNIGYILLLSLLAVFVGCQKQNVLSYENDPRLFFMNGVDYDQVPAFRQFDSLSYSFFVLPEDQQRDTVYIVIETMGLTSDQPRAFSLVQTNLDSVNAAIPGKHYVSFESDEMKQLMTIPAGAVRYYMPLIVLRGDPLLDDAEVRLDMKIAENENFKVGINDESEFTVKITAMASEPSEWRSWSVAFGDWSSTKMWFIINYISADFDFEEYLGDYDYAYYLKTLAIQRLEEYNATHPTLMDGDEPVSFE